MRKPRIALASLGGTITMTSEQAGQGVRPTLDASALIAAVPCLDEVAELSATTLFTVPGASISFDQLYEALLWARLAVEQGIDGVVLVQGTDTIEETAYFFDLYWDHPEPLIITGAMRPPQALGSDGPANLLAAVRVAGDAVSRGMGAFVVINDEVHAAARVRKVRSSGLAAFSSPSFGTLGYIEEGHLVYGNTLRRAAPLSLPVDWKTRRVALLETHLGDEGHLLRLAADSGFHGAVVEAFGVGHVSNKLADVIGSVIEVMPVVMTTRTGAGTTFSKTYGFPGSERDLLERGVIPAGWLDGRKATILLNCLLAMDLDRESMRAEFVARGLYTGGLI